MRNGIVWMGAFCLFCAGGTSWAGEKGVKKNPLVGVYLLDYASLVRNSLANMPPQIKGNAQAEAGYRSVFESLRGRLTLSADGRATTISKVLKRPLRVQEGTWTQEGKQVAIKVQLLADKTQYSETKCHIIAKGLRCQDPKMPFAVQFLRAPGFVGEWTVKAGYYGKDRKQKVELKPKTHWMHFEASGAYQSTMWTNGFQQGKPRIAKGSWKLEGEAIVIKAGNKNYKFRFMLTKSGRLHLIQRKETMELELETP